MPRPALRRALALFALALALFSALPCASLAGGHACCAQARAHCADADANAAPCAQLGAAPCCGAREIPAAASFAVQLPTFDFWDVQDAWAAPLDVTLERAPTRTPPPALVDHATIRDVVLRL